MASIKDNTMSASSTVAAPARTVHPVAYCVAVDVETGGQFVRSNPLISLGWCAGEIFSGPVPATKQRVSLVEPPDRVMEPRCVIEYWNRPAQKEQLKTFRDEAEPIADGLATFLHSVRQVERQATANNVPCFIVSDNPAFDIAFINEYLDVYYHHHPTIQHSLTQFGVNGHPVYRGVGDEWETLRRLARKLNVPSVTVTPELCRAVEQDIDRHVAHDHWPDNDAECIYRRTSLLCRRLLT